MRLFHIFVSTKRIFRDRLRHTYNCCRKRMQLATRAKRPILSLGLVFCTIGILWAVNSSDPPPAVHLEVQPEVTMDQEQSNTQELFNTRSLQEQIEDGLGLTVATVTVTMVRPEQGTVLIPWRDNLRPLVHISVPQSWVSRMRDQVGSAAVVLSSVKTIAEDIAPGSQFVITTIQDAGQVTTVKQPSESYAKQIVMVIGLIAVLLSGHVVDRRRKTQESVVVMHVDHPEMEATRILEMDHQGACEAIDTLEGTRRIEVLRSIVALGDSSHEPPVVQVPDRQQLEFTKCG